MDHTTVAAYLGLVLSTVALVPQLVGWLKTKLQVSAHVATCFYPDGYGGMREAQFIRIRVVNELDHPIRVDAVTFNQENKANGGWALTGFSGSEAAEAWRLPFVVNAHDSVNLSLPWGPELWAKVPFHVGGISTQVRLTTGQVIKSKVLTEKELGPVGTAPALTRA